MLRFWGHTVRKDVETAARQMLVVVNARKVVTDGAEWPLVLECDTPRAHTFCLALASHQRQTRALRSISSAQTYHKRSDIERPFDVDTSGIPASPRPQLPTPPLHILPR